MPSRKGKEKVSDSGGKGKRKWSGGGGADPDKTGQKRKNPHVVQFFDDVAYQMDDSEESSDDFFSDEDLEEEDFISGLKSNYDPAKISHFPVIKDEAMTEEELDKMLEDRYKPGAGFVTYAEDGDDLKNSIEKDAFVTSSKDIAIWRVKCTVGRERHSAFCLMQKFADLCPLGTKLRIISACALDHVKGSIFVEAERQNDIYEACNGIPTIYTTKVSIVPSNEVSRLLAVRNMSSGISVGMWARVKSGRYKGDLAQVVSVNNPRKKVTVKLVPRIDLKAMAEKFGGGVAAKRNTVPPQRLISSSELEEFRPLIQFRRDRDTNLMFEILDGMMLKDGYLYKKIPIDSMIFWGVTPTEDELLKFEPSKKDESTDVQWLLQLYGEKKKKKVEIIKPDKGGKSGGSCSFAVSSNFEVLDLVFIGRKDFGVVLGSEKDDTVKILKEGSEGPSVVSHKPSELKSASFDRKLFTVLDQHSNTLSVNDTVRILDGPLKDKQGIIKKIYKGVLFLYDESQEENGGFTCVKARLCEKVGVSGGPSNQKVGESGPSDFPDMLPSPKSLLSPTKPLQEDDNNKSSFTRDDTGMFAVGQCLRIRVGPLKGYLCRVLAVRRTDVTVKLDSQQKILTVKSDNLSEVRGRNAAAAASGEDPASAKPFDFLGAQDGAGDWMGGAPMSVDENKWAAGESTERSSWSSFPSSSLSLSKEPGSVDAADNDANKDAGGSWDIKAAPDQSSSWGAAAASSWDKKATPDQSSWGAAASGSSQDMKATPDQSSSWGAAAAKSIQPDSWGKTADPQQDSSWGKTADKWSSGGDASALWGRSKASGEAQKDNSWGGSAGKWGSTFGSNTSKSGEDATDNQVGGWNKPKPVVSDAAPSWNKQDGKSSWGKPEGMSSLNKQDGGSSWSKPDAGSSFTGGSSWNKSPGKSSWGSQSDVNNAEEKSKGWGNQKDHSSKSDGSAINQGSGGWSKDGTENKEDSKKDNSWSKASTDGEGSGWGGSTNLSKSSDHGDSSNWDKSTNTNEDAGGWNSGNNTKDDKKLSWNADGNKSSEWNRSGNWGSQKSSQENSGGWNQTSAGDGKDGEASSWKNNNAADGSGSSGWGQSNWLKGGTSETGGNSGSTWSSKGGNWSSGNRFGGGNDQDSPSRDDGGRGGNWRGRGGRGDRGGFRGRGRYDRGGFGGRSDRGGYGGRSDRGGFGGRGDGSGRGGFRGKGVFVVGVVSGAEAGVIGITEEMIPMQTNPSAGVQMSPGDGKAVAMQTAGSKEGVTTITQARAGVRAGVNQKVKHRKEAAGAKGMATARTLLVDGKLVMLLRMKSHLIHGAKLQKAHGVREVAKALKHPKEATGAKEAAATRKHLVHGKLAMLLRMKNHLIHGAKLQKAHGAREVAKAVKHPKEAAGAKEAAATRKHLVDGKLVMLLRMKSHLIHGAKLQKAHGPREVAKAGGENLLWCRRQTLKDAGIGLMVGDVD